MSAPESRVAGVEIAGRPVGGYRPLWPEAGAHDGCTPAAHGGHGEVAGYVVRRTVEDGRRLWQGVPNDSRSGYDVAAFDGTPLGHNDAYQLMKGLRDGDRSWAKIDYLYACGHRD